MRLSLVLSTLLCLATWMSSVHTTNGPVSSCCLQWSNTKVRVHRILDYAIQSEGVCPITAVVFYTKSGKRICSDPSGNWTIKAMTKVDEERGAMLKEGQDEEGESSSDNKGPTDSTGPKKERPQKRGRNGRKRQGRRKNRRGRKGQRKNV
uniref:eotaxin-like n=1 Tax=Centroberyx gerrardi TaxID=166262 RepID=UPI003AAAB7E3